ncbi:phosphate ABC transporter permease subunit PstC [Aestuariispira insulae]|uniref:Phosphate transport system permease protein n=1 Tax=Aestuariispira insulae TaxID=1461337 RepID=A0A3D9HE26_9PROT|nr:phosphate ABC transporter permease subunit PstC [Aestuariispira insulae]RED47719.1 phosphate ABC transporter membrane protein 1 (PhoT family) [Aestuariispira insulae]
MTTLLISLAFLVLVALAFRIGRTRVVRLGTDAPGGGLHSLPGYYGAYAVLWCVVPALILTVVWLIAEPVIIRDMVLSGAGLDLADMAENQVNLVYNDIKNIAAGLKDASLADPAIQTAAQQYSSLQSTSFMAMLVVFLGVAALGLFLALQRINPKMRARQAVERTIMWLLIGCSCVAILTTAGIVMSLIFETMRFFAKVPVTEFLFGMDWSPQMALRSDQVGSSGAFGAVPIFAGTMLISFLAMMVAAPIGLYSAIYMAEYATPRFRSTVKPMLEILAGIPTVVYGFFAALTVAPVIRGFGQSIGLDVASESALAAGLVMGVMIIPFVSSLSDDVISAVPHSLREGSYGLGATKSETIKQVIFPAALPGIVGSLLLAVSRAIGETMIVVMAAGLAANLTANPFQAVTTVTVQIVTLLVGDQEFDSPKTLAAFALGLVLFIVTLILNIIALRVVRKYREQYD